MLPCSFYFTLILWLNAFWFVDVLHPFGGLIGWARDTHASKLASLGLNLNPAINCHPGVSQAGWFISVCTVHRMDIKLASCLPEFVDVKDLTMSFVKSRRGIAGTLNKLQILALTNSGHCISGTATPSANDAYRIRSPSSMLGRVVWFIESNIWGKRTVSVYLSCRPFLAGSFVLYTWDGPLVGTCLKLCSRGSIGLCSI